MKKTRNSLQASTGSRQLSLLPEPNFIAKWPPRNTHTAIALSMLLPGEMVSHPDFQSQTSSWRLAAYIHELRKLGWPVQTVEVRHCSIRRPLNRHIRRYYLPQDFLEMLRKLGGHND